MKELLDTAAEQPALLDLVDNALNKGVVVTGDVVLGLAGVDLIYLRLSVMLVGMERLLKGSQG